MAVRESGNIARRLGGNIVQRLHPGYISPEVLAQQAILKRFEGRLGVVGDLIDTDNSFQSEDELEARASSTARALVEVGVVDPQTAVELRPVLPKDAIRDPALNGRREKVVRLLGQTLAHDYDVTSVPITHPIMPSEHEDSPIDIAATWAAISTELDLLSHQLDGKPHRQPAMLAITGAPYSQAVLEAQPGRSQLIDHYGLLVLQRVGTLPEDNLLVPADRPSTPEDRDTPNPSIWIP